MTHTLRIVHDVTMAAPRILVVDNDASVRLFAERALRHAGYEVFLAGDAVEALQLAEGIRPFDVFVIDLVMPTMTGAELALALRRRDPDARVLYFTGFDGQIFKEEGLSVHGTHLDKPVTAQGLLEAVSLLLYGHTQGPGTKRG
jgi:CheY-like chemotaxis protein